MSKEIWSQIKKCIVDDPKLSLAGLRLFVSELGTRKISDGRGRDYMELTDSETKVSTNSITTLWEVEDGRDVKRAVLAGQVFRVVGVRVTMKSRLRFLVFGERETVWAVSLEELCDLFDPFTGSFSHFLQVADRHGIISGYKPIKAAMEEKEISTELVERYEDNDDFGAFG